MTRTTPTSTASGSTSLMCRRGTTYSRWVCRTDLYYLYYYSHFISKWLLFIWFPGNGEPLSPGRGVWLLQQRGSVWRQVHGKLRPGEKLQDRCVSQVKYSRFSRVTLEVKMFKVFFFFASQELTWQQTEHLTGKHVLNLFLLLLMSSCWYHHLFASKWICIYMIYCIQSQDGSIWPFTYLYEYSF